MNGNINETETVETFGDEPDLGGDTAIFENDGDEPDTGEESFGENGSADLSADGDESADSSGTDGGSDSHSDVQSESGGAQSPEENSKYAAARREAERQRDAAIAAERERHDREFADVFKTLGMIDPYTQKPITTKGEYDAYMRAHDAARKADFMQRNGLDEAGYQAMISELPEVRAAREAAARAETAKKQAEYEKIKARVDDEIKDIGKMNPAIKSVDDLMADPSYPDVLSKVQRGYSLSDAYRVANFDAIAARTSAAAKQQLLNQRFGKEHLPKSDPGGRAIDAVPSDVVAMYRDLDPSMTDAQIAKSYQSFKRALK